MNSGNLVHEVFVLFLLVTLAAPSPIIRDTEGSYRFPPSFTDTFPANRPRENHNHAPRPLTNIQTNPDAVTEQLSPIPSPVGYVDTDHVVTLKGNSFPVVGDQQPVLKISGSASLHFRFWKSISKKAIPTVQFLRNSLEHLVLNYCQDNSEIIPDDCLDFALNLVSNWNVEDFIRSPSENVMLIKNQKKFDKKLLTDVIQVLRYNRRNLTDLLAIEKRHICGSEVACDVDCSLGSSLFCVLNDVIVPDIDELIIGLGKEAKSYFGARISRNIPQQMNPERMKYYSKYRVFYVLGTMYNMMLQMFETETALSYILDLSNLSRLQVKL